jgi:hypothetical protein
MERNDGATALREWNALLARLFASDMPFHAASYDALDWFVPKKERDRWGLLLGRPGDPRPPVASTDLPDHPLLAGMPDPVRLAVRAGEQGSRELTLLLCRHHACTEGEIAEILGCAGSTIAAVRRELVKAGLLKPVAGKRYQAA